MSNLPHTPDFHQQKKPSFRFTGIFIPVEILEMDEISLFEKFLLAMIDALYSKEEGGCFASNDYLATQLGCKVNTVAKAIGNLRKLGLILDVSFDGRRRIIRACIHKVVEEKQAAPRNEGQSNAALDKNPTLGVTKIQQGYPSPYYYNIDDKKKNDPPTSVGSSPPPAKPAPPPPPEAEEVSSFLFQKLKEKNPSHKKPNLKAWSRQIGEIMRLDKRDAAGLKAVIAWAFQQEDKFWATAIQSPQTLRRLYDRACIAMNHSSPQEKAEKKEKEKLERIEENKLWAKKNVKRISFERSDQRMRVQDTGVWIENGREQGAVGYAEPQFKEIIRTKLKTWGYEIQNE